MIHLIKEIIQLRMIVKISKGLVFVFILFFSNCNFDKIDRNYSYSIKESIKNKLFLYNLKTQNNKLIKYAWVEKNGIYKAGLGTIIQLNSGYRIQTIINDSLKISDNIKIIQSETKNKLSVGFLTSKPNLLLIDIETLTDTINLIYFKNNSLVETICFTKEK